jgi:hypothetical protein
MFSSIKHTWQLYGLRHEARRRDIEFRELLKMAISDNAPAEVVESICREWVTQSGVLDRREEQIRRQHTRRIRAAS